MICNRRRFIQSSFSLPFVIYQILPEWLTSININSRIVINDFIFDEQLSVNNVELSQVVYGSSIHTIGDDLTDLWYRHLDLAWKRAATSTAGITTIEALFFLERLGLDRGLRLIHLEPYSVFEKVDRELVSWILAPQAAALNTQETALAFNLTTS